LEKASARRTKRAKPQTALVLELRGYSPISVYSNCNSGASFFREFCSIIRLFAGPDFIGHSPKFRTPQTPVGFAQLQEFSGSNCGRQEHLRHCVEVVKFLSASLLHKRPNQDHPGVDIPVHPLQHRRCSTALSSNSLTSSRSVPEAALRTLIRRAPLMLTVPA